MFSCNVVFTIRSHLQVLIFGRFDPNCLFCFEIKHDATIFEIKLSCVSFAQHSRMFLVGSSSLSTTRTTVPNYTASLKFHCSLLPRKWPCHLLVRRSAFYLVIPNSCTPCGWPLCILKYLLLHSSHEFPCQLQ